MIVLVINILLCLFYVLLLNGTNLIFSTRRKIFYFLTFLQIFCLRTFVDPLSLPDLSVYEDILDCAEFADFDEIFRGEYLAVCEVGYFILCKLSALVTDNFHFLLAIISLIWIISYFNIFRKYSPYYAVPVLLLLVTELPQSLFVLRQHLAIAIWLFAYPSVINRNLKSFLLIGVLATSFHTTGLFFFPIYFLYGIINAKSFAFNILILSIFIAVGFGALSVINETMGLSYDNYIYGGKSGESNLTDFFMRLTYFLSYWYFCRSKIFDNGIYRLITTIMVFSILIAFFGTSFSLTGRIVRYFTPASMLLVPIVMEHIKLKSVKYLYFSCIFLLNAYSIFEGSISGFIRDYRFI